MATLRSTLACPAGVGMRCVNFLNCCDWPFAKSITYEMLPTIIPATSSTIVATGRSFL